jgi:hypothetical protein
MALSPVQRHIQRVEMEQQLKRQQSVTISNSLHLQIQALAEDVDRAQSQPTRADRTAFKRDVLLPRWLPTATEYLDAGIVFANPVFAWCIVWLFDTGEFEQGLAWADIAIEQQQPTPEAFRSNFPTFVADAVLDWAEATAAAGESVEPYFSHTFERVATKWRLHEEVTAKWFKFAGLMLLRDDNGRPVATAINDVETLQKADALLASAEGFHKKVGVGTVRKTIAARIRSLTK